MPTKKKRPTFPYAKDIAFWKQRFVTFAFLHQLGLVEIEQAQERARINEKAKERIRGELLQLGVTPEEMAELDALVISAHQLGSLTTIVRTSTIFREE